MPSVRSCDPAAYGQAFNTTIMDVGGVRLELRWGWDGVSPYPECDGPMVNGTGQQGNWAAKATNPTGQTFYAHTTRKNGQPATYALLPGQTVTLSAGQLAANGYSTYSDFYDLTLTTTP